MKKRNGATINAIAVPELGNLGFNLCFSGSMYGLDSKFLA